MTRSPAAVRRAVPLILGLAASLAVLSPALAQTRHHLPALEQVADDERPLTISPRHRSGDIYRSGNHIIAPGGFSAHGFGYPQFPNTPAGHHAAEIAQLRDKTEGLYGYGGDGIGGTGFYDGETGYDNPSYGGAFNQYVGYNGVPTNLAFGPAFAFRRYANHDPVDDAPEPIPSPGELGYSAAPPQ